MAPKEPPSQSPSSPSERPGEDADDPNRTAFNPIQEATSKHDGPPLPLPHRNCLAHPSHTTTWRTLQPQKGIHPFPLILGSSM